MVKTLANEIKELQDRLLKILEGENRAYDWPDFVNDPNVRRDFLHTASKNISNAIEVHITDGEFDDEYLDSINEAMEILYAILEQHHRI